MPSITATQSGSASHHRLMSHDIVGIAVIFITIMALTEPNFLGDTLYYGQTVLGFVEGRDHWEYWDFGHLLWRPAILLTWKLCSPLAGLLVGESPLHQMMAIEILLNLVAGLGCAVIVGAIAKLISQSSVISLGVVTTFVSSHAVMNHAQTGSAYIPGLFFVLCGYYLILRHALGYPSHRHTPFWGGVGLGIGAGFWFMFSLAAPGAALLGFLTSRSTGIKTFIRTSLGTGVALLLAIVPSAYLSGIRNLSELLEWVGKASHGIEITGLSRMVFGLVNSFVDLGDLGLTMKRYLIHDILNPVSLSEFVFRLWIVAAFYIVLLLLFLRTVRLTDGKKLAFILTLGIAPVILFAMYWQGRDTERYLALYPALIIMCSFVATSSLKLGRVVMTICATYLIAHNVNALWFNTIQSKHQQTLARIAPLTEIAPPGTRVGVLKDSQLVRLPWDLPFQYDKKKLAVHVVINFGMDKTPIWKKLLKEEVETTWNQGGDFWISNRLLVEKPLRDWEWIEGEDRSITWQDVYATFNQLEYDQTIGGTDGFTRLSRNEANKAKLLSIGG